MGNDQDDAVRSRHLAITRPSPWVERFAPLIPAGGINSYQKIRELFNLYDVSQDEKKQLADFLVKLERRRALLEQQREDIEVMLNEISFFANQCRRLLKGKPEGDGSKAVA